VLGRCSLIAAAAAAAVEDGSGATLTARQRRSGSVLGDGEDRRVDPEIACEAELHRRVAASRPSQHRWTVVLEVAGAEQHDGDDDDIGGPAGNEGVESGIDGGFSQLEEPEADEAGRHQALDGGYQPVEFDGGPRITTAMTEDEQGRPAPVRACRRSAL